MTYRCADGLVFWSSLILIKRYRCQTVENIYFGECNAHFCNSPTVIHNFSSFHFFLYILREWDICCHVVCHDAVLHISNWRVSESIISSDLLTLPTRRMKQSKRLECHCSSSCSLCQSAIWVNVSYLPYIQQCLFGSSFCVSIPTLQLGWYLNTEFPVLYIKLNLNLLWQWEITLAIFVFQL